MRIKKTDAKREYGGLTGWLSNSLDLPDEADIAVKDGGMYGNLDFIVSFPNGAEVMFSGYASSRSYSVSMTQKTHERIEDLAMKFRA